VSLSEQVDMSTPTGKMLFTVLGALAELERSLIVERVKVGLRNAAETAAEGSSSYSRQHQFPDCHQSEVLSGVKTLFLVF